MPDCFISYSTKDQEFADRVHAELLLHKLTAFMASASLQPGQKWSVEIKENLANSRWVLFLASKSACSSEYVQQELGQALATNKKIVPIIWDIEPGALPAWVKDYQALDLRKSPHQLAEKISDIAKRIHREKVDEQKKGFVILAAIVGGLFLLGGNA